MKWIAFFFLALVLILCGCMSATHETSHGGRYGSRFALSEERLTVLTRDANHGDGRAAYLIALHYLYALCDSKTGDQWMSKSRQLRYEPNPDDVP
ncbi:MAG: hypothetical protein RIS79_643 [Verrucomicrobiota bacterium]|jgi:hypothetical protein